MFLQRFSGQAVHICEQSFLRATTLNGVSSLGRLTATKKNHIHPSHCVIQSRTLLSNTIGSTVRTVSGSTTTADGEDDEDSFGSLAQDELRKYRIPTRTEVETEEVNDHHIRLSNYNRRHTPAYYGHKIEKLTKQGKIFEAIEVLETEMLKKDRVLPSSYVFTTLIGGLGRVGYTEKAFKLFNKMKKMGFPPEDPTYTALFNACSNSPDKNDGLLRAQKLRILMREKEVSPNLTTYKAMIKAFGMCGDLQTAFSLVDEILVSGYRLDQEVFCHLLIASISDKDAGLKHAIEVWRRMRKKSVKPNLELYNLLLRAIRDCGLGDQDQAKQLLRRKEYNPNAYGNGQGEEQHHQPEDKYVRDNIKPNTDTQTKDDTDRSNVLRLTPLSDEEDISVFDKVKDNSIKASPENVDIDTEHKYWWQYKEKSLVELMQHEDTEHQPSARVSALDMDVPNILNPRGLVSDVIGLSDLSDPTARLSLFGGLAGFLSHMNKDKTKPDIKTFSQLLDLLPNTKDAEFDLLSSMGLHKVDPDVDFYNAVIRRRVARKHLTDALAVYDEIIKRGKQPTMLTFASLALGCYKSTALKLLADMETLDMTPTTDIMGILLRRSRQDYRYKKQLLHHMMKHNIRPTRAILVHLEKGILLAQNILVSKEKGMPVPPFYATDEFKRDFLQFMGVYRGWLKQIEIETEGHPWDKFRQPHPDTVAKQQKEEEEMENTKL